MKQAGPRIQVGGLTRLSGASIRSFTVFMLYQGWWVKPPYSFTQFYPG